MAGIPPSLKMYRGSWDGVYWYFSPINEKKIQKKIKN
jgi:hypothetical protein